MKNRLILKASAGTGKTYRLSLEYVASLCCGNDFKDILVMTFTKKATAEIKDRILKFLKQLKENGEEAKELRENILKLYPEIDFNQSKIEKIYEEVVQNRDKLRIYTIDAFTNLIFKKAIAPYLKIYSYEIIDEEENKKTIFKILDKLFTIKEDFAKFKEFLKDNTERDIDNYIDLIDKLLSHRWKIIVLGDKLNIKREPFQVKSNFNIMENLLEIVGSVAIEKKEPTEAFIAKRAKSYFLLESELEKEKFLLDKFKELLEGNIWDGRKITKKNKRVDDLNYLQEELRLNLAKTLFNEKIIPYEEKLLQVINRIYEIYDEIKFKEQRFTFSDISNYTFKYIRDKNLNFVDENGVTDDFFDIIDGKIKTIFIDEFQDTSILQWKILKDIIDKSENVICVGDEKQSIYGWRGGEKNLFENLEKIIGGEVENLNTCYRSEENVVRFYNKFFKTLSEKSEESSKKWEFLEVNPKNQNQKGHIEILTKDLLEDEEEKENISVIDKIIEKIQLDFNGVYEGIGILARQNKELDLIEKKLTEANIPFVVDSNVNVIESRGIKGIYYLIKYLVKNDYLSLLNFLRCDLVNISADSLKHLVKEREDIENWLLDYSSEIDLNDEEREVLEIVKELKDKYNANDGETYFLTYDILQKLGVTERFSSKGDISNLYSFYKIIKSYRYFDEFLSEFEDQKNSSKFKKIVLKDENSVNLMTIHKSKGLEFDTLFYYYNPKTSQNNIPKVIFYFTMDNKYEEAKEFLLTNTKFNYILKILSSEFGYLEENRIKEEHEEINNLYVALTRPKNNIYIALEKYDESKNKDGYNLDMINCEKEFRDREIIFTEVQSKDKNDKRETFELNLSTPEASYPKGEESIFKDREKIYSHSLQNEVKRLKGTVVHYFLENLIYATNEEIERAKKLTFAKFASNLGEKGIGEILSEKNIEYILNKKKEIFSKDWDKIYPEYEIYTEDETFRIDRLMIKEAKEGEKGCVYIVDYKTGEINEEQLANYKTIIENLLERLGKENEYEVITEFIEYKK
ncbi:MAG: UvrD-helicase domain-containing protein [Fusobacterium sp.]|uniref:UvrD-helicase domain-containing protein n=1 Tax=Fusobacterium sp. TaxID=68766 RepID=UPI00294383C6|nr:UvrD-helicase domain-containing protein [Fusobacterium sp.]MDY3058592.1 UvrD-helicase domain-containing protein [Fusobacterium sp.]